MCERVCVLIRVVGQEHEKYAASFSSKATWPFESSSCMCVCLVVVPAVTHIHQALLSSDLGSFGPCRVCFFFVCLSSMVQTLPGYDWAFVGPRELRSTTFHFMCCAIPTTKNTERGGRQPPFCPSWCTGFPVFSTSLQPKSPSSSSNCPFRLLWLSFVTSWTRQGHEI